MPANSNIIANAQCERTLNTTIFWFEVWTYGGRFRRRVRNLSYILYRSGRHYTEYTLHGYYCKLSIKYIQVRQKFCERF